MPSCSPLSRRFGLSEVIIAGVVIPPMTPIRLLTVRAHGNGERSCKVPVCQESESIVKVYTGKADCFIELLGNSKSGEPTGLSMAIPDLPIYEPLFSNDS